MSAKLTPLPSLCKLGPLFLLASLLPAQGAKVWTSTVSGDWSDGANWSGGTAPNSANPAVVQITNANTKTVAINAATPSTNLTVASLLIGAPAGSINTLLLTNAGTSSPLLVLNSLAVTNSGALRITNSALVIDPSVLFIGINGTVTLDSGLITFGNNQLANTTTTKIGNSTTGTLVINAGAVSAGELKVGADTAGAVGLMTMNGGALDISTMFSLGHELGTTGIVSVLGGLLTATNDDTRVGAAGFGQLTVSNATLSLTNFVIGHDASSAGTFNLQTGGLVILSNNLSIARFDGSTGTVFVAGGKLSAIGQQIYVGRGGNGQMTLSGGMVETGDFHVAGVTNTGSGLLTMTGGNLIVGYNFVIGSASLSAGTASVSGGAVTVTNGAATGILSVPNGSLTLGAGNLTTDNLLLTNSSGQFAFNGGTLSTKNTTVANGTPFVVGNGVTAATLYLNGGTHAFSNGLVISANATLSGCGTIIGAITNHGTIATNCGGNVLPSITAQPAARTNNAGTTATFTVIASGTAPLRYQWKKGAVNLTNTGNVSGADTATLTVSNVLKADEGSYTAVVTNVAGSVVSSNAVLTVIDPVILTQPAAQVVPPSSNATFMVVAAGTALQYQWRLNGTNLPAATNASLVVSNVSMADSGGVYSVVVTNVFGSVLSSSAALTVSSQPIITRLISTGTTNSVFFTTSTGHTYTLQFITSLGDTNWTSVPPPVNGTGNVMSAQDIVVDVLTRFYRVLAQ